jgi:hypothetical protein
MCSASQPSHHAGLPTRSRLRRQRGGFLVALTLGHHRPRHSGDLVGERDRRDLGRPARQQRCEPGSARGAVDLGITDDGERASREQAAQIPIALFADTAEPILAPTLVLLRREPDPGREVSEHVTTEISSGPRLSVPRTRRQDPAHQSLELQPDPVVLLLQTEVPDRGDTK